MKQTTAHTQAVWDSGDFAGQDRRPTTRVTIQKMVAPHIQYRLDDSVSRQWAHSGRYTSILFGQEGHRPRELFNVLSVKWQRGVDTDVASCTIVLGNVEVRNDLDPESDAELDFPGYYTPNRGTESYFDQWGYVSNEWRGWLQPDRIVRTYEGYGTDVTLAPERDPHLYPSGVWMIDDVVLSTDGRITLECRDIGRALLDQVVFPGLIPWKIYPLWFEAFSDRAKPQTVVAPNGNLDWEIPIYEKDSNLPYIGSGISDNGRPVVANDGTVYGHHGRDAFDADNQATFWVSCGKRSKNQSDSYEYIQGRLPNPAAVDAVKLDVQGGPFRVYISLQDSTGQWLGRKRIPYKARNVDTNANIRYVHEFTVQSGETLAVKLPKRYKDVKRIRYTFTTAFMPIGDKLNYRAKASGVWYANNVSLENAPGSWKYGNYKDYTDVVKWLLAWGGFYWPNADSGFNTVTYSDGSQEVIAPSGTDSAIPDGRVWGDLEKTGTAGQVKLDVDIFDKRPLMDGINAVRETVGFDFWIDETGGAIWRMPNIFEKGCYVMPTKGGPRSTRTTTLVEIDERKHLIDMEVRLSSRNVRERIYVGNAVGHKGAVVGGYRPDRTGLRRLAGWTDQRFATNDECERMADLIALKQSFLYRQNSLTITANPALQPDDQVIITERTTGEGYIHRILNISSDFDNETGRWTYTLTTNWLGTKAFTRLAWDPQKLRYPTLFFLRGMGKNV